MKTSLNIQLSIEELKELIEGTVRASLSALLNNTGDNKMMSVRRVCEYLDISKQTYYNWVKGGILKPFYIGHKPYIRVQELQDAISTSPVKSQHQIDLS
ncbi:MAG: helix-turn-helix domain-containing protein [Bacteroidia bacterium]|nr:helix-turn-helix domain-containing protein [Bacteroidia bacterium]